MHSIMPRFIDAVRLWAETTNKKFTIPKKGTADYEDVMGVLEELKKVEAHDARPKKASKMSAPMASAAAPAPAPKKKRKIRIIPTYEMMMNEADDVESILRILWLFNNKEDFDGTKEAQVWYETNESPAGEDWRDEYLDDITNFADSYIDRIMEIAKEKKISRKRLIAQMQSIVDDGGTMFEDTIEELKKKRKIRIVEEEKVDSLKTYLKGYSGPYQDYVDGRGEEVIYPTSDIKEIIRRVYANESFSDIQKQVGYDEEETASLIYDHFIGRNMDNPKAYSDDKKVMKIVRKFVRNDD